MSKSNDELNTLEYYLEDVFQDDYLTKADAIRAIDRICHPEAREAVTEAFLNEAIQCSYCSRYTIEDATRLCEGCSQRVCEPCIESGNWKEDYCIECWGQSHGD